MAAMELLLAIRKEAEETPSTISGSSEPWFKPSKQDLSCVYKTSDKPQNPNSDACHRSITCIRHPCGVGCEYSLEDPTYCHDHRSCLLRPFVKNRPYTLRKPIECKKHRSCMLHPNGAKGKCTLEKTLECHDHRACLSPHPYGTDKQCRRCDNHLRCPEKDCGKKFYVRDHYVRHMADHEEDEYRKWNGKDGTIVTKESPFFCDVCRTYFFTVDQLNKHLARHYGDAPYTCEICDKKWEDDVHAFKKHWLDVHGCRKPFAWEDFTRKQREAGLIHGPGWHYACHPQPEPCCKKPPPPPCCEPPPCKKPPTCPPKNVGFADSKKNKQPSKINIRISLSKSLLKAA